MDTELKDLFALRGIEDSLDDHRHHCEGKYAKKGTANAALGLAIGGLALGLFNKRNGGLFGDCGFGGGSNCDDSPTPFQAWKKVCDVEMGALSNLYQARIQDLSEKADIVAYFNNKVCGAESRLLALETAVPLKEEIACLKAKLMFNESIDYTNKKTCNVIYGDVVLPSTPVVTGFQGANAPHVHVQSNPAAGCGC